MRGAEVDELLSKIEGYASREAQLTKKRIETQLQADAYAEELRMLRNEDSSLREQNATLRAQAVRLEKERDDAQLRAERLQHKLEAVFNSRSWRVSAPLRAIKRFLTGISPRKGV